ncbi:MOB kinase activator 1B-like [Olea europaea var. sylvestris]|uniref:MOB kinase activator 1B-like n=1 Tax=Olea europaea var. sylvestris TaxID=158386 RepID=UPI000C1D19D9|nr:MOB kinase activator 1B-like [Olea europaea var. sylvestris]
MGLLSPGYTSISTKVIFFKGDIQCSENLREVVRLPPAKDITEWPALACCQQCVDFVNHINLLERTLAEFYKPEKYLTRSTNPKYEYKWKLTSELHMNCKCYTVGGKDKYSCFSSDCKLSHSLNPSSPWPWPRKEY